MNEAKSLRHIKRILLIQNATSSTSYPMKSQTKFDKLKSELAFGGSLLKKAKNRHARPVSTKDPTHLVLKSTKAVGQNSFGHSRNYRAVNALIDNHCAKYGVKLIMYSNNFSHLHLLVKFGSRQTYMRFIRTLTAALASLITGAKKNSGNEEPFFDFRPFTRIVKGFKPYNIVRDYIRLNQLEAAGVIPYQKARLKNLNEFERSFF